MAFNYSKLTLNEAREYQQLIEKRISEVSTILCKSNNKNTLKDIEERASLAILLLQVKMALQYGNMRKHGFLGLFGETNYQLIFKIAEYKRHKEVLDNAASAESKLTATIAKQASALTQKLENFKTSLDGYNNSIKIKIPITELSKKFLKQK